MINNNAVTSKELLKKARNKATFEGYCPFEIGDIVSLNVELIDIKMEVYDIIQINSIRHRSSRFECACILEDHRIIRFNAEQLKMIKHNDKR